MSCEAAPEAKRDGPAVTIFVSGPPKGKGRPRSRIVRTRSGQEFVSIYSDPQTVAYEKVISYAAQAAMRRAGLREVFDCPLVVRVTAIFEPPQSWSLKKQGDALAGLIVHTARPDCDNIFKVVDSLNEIVWRDDALIVKSITQKVYGRSPGLYIEVWQWLPPRLL